MPNVKYVFYEFKIPPTCHGIAGSVTILCTQIFNFVFLGITLALDIRSIVRDHVSVHDIDWLVLVSKSIEPYIKFSVVIYQVKIDVSSVPGPLVFAVLDQRVLTRNGNAHKVRLEKNAFPNGHSIYIGNGW